MEELQMEVLSRRVFKIAGDGGETEISMGELQDGDRFRMYQGYDLIADEDGRTEWTASGEPTRDTIAGMEVWSITVYEHEDD